ncbi:MAG: redoxin domain-containing protein [Flavobacteriales bacterium]|nr:redoxin domain-containing protein [Flavobacteriales bacterium]
MKKLLLMSSLIASTAAMAQLPDGSICPDFTGTDLNGVTHNLYDYLDQGYTVVVDVSATWCGPCWNYHNTGALEDLYTTYGPGTAADKVMVLFHRRRWQHDHGRPARATLAPPRGTGSAEHHIRSSTTPALPTCWRSRISLRSTPFAQAGRSWKAARSAPLLIGQLPTRVTAKRQLQAPTWLLPLTTEAFRLAETWTCQ